MDHVRIFANLVNLLLGLAALVLVWRVYSRHGLAFLKSLGLYIACLNGMVMLNFVAQYARTNLFAGNELAMPIWVIALLFLVLLCTEFGTAYWLHRVTRELEGAAVSPVMSSLFVAWVAAFAVAHAAALMQGAASHTIALIYWTHAAWLATMFVIIFASLLTLLIRGSGLQGRLEKRSIRALAMLFLVAYSFYLIEELLFYFSNIRLDQVDLPLLLLNLCAPAWLCLFFVRDARLGAHLDGALADRLVRECGISDREQEVIGQLLQGKSNREIAASLHISENTVKNHLYSIYRKLEVSTRAQLLSKLRREG